MSNENQIEIQSILRVMSRDLLEATLGEYRRKLREGSMIKQCSRERRDIKEFIQSMRKCDEKIKNLSEPKQLKLSWIEKLWIK